VVAQHRGRGGSLFFESVKSDRVAVGFYVESIRRCNPASRERSSPARLSGRHELCRGCVGNLAWPTMSLAGMIDHRYHRPTVSTVQLLSKFTPQNYTVRFTPSDLHRQIYTTRFTPSNFHHCKGLRRFWTVVLKC
jgi:hypothetical protein